MRTRRRGGRVYDRPAKPRNTRTARFTRTMGESRRLRKQPPVNQGGDEIAYRLSLHQHRVVNQVVARVQVDHPNIEYAAPTRCLEQRRVPLGTIDQELMGLSRHTGTAPTVRRGRRRCHRLTR